MEENSVAQERRRKREIALHAEVEERRGKGEDFLLTYMCAHACGEEEEEVSLSSKPLLVMVFCCEREREARKREGFMM